MTTSLLIAVATLFQISISMQTKTLFIGEVRTKEPLIGAKIYSFHTDKCYQTDLRGYVSFPLVDGGSLQVEQTGYKLKTYTFEEIQQLDSVFLREFGDIELGLTGIEPVIATDEHQTLCKCCRQ